MKVHQLIKHLQKYPGDLEVSLYRPPITGGYNILAPNFTDPEDGVIVNHWLYSAKRLYIPMAPFKKAGSLPSHYRLPRKPKGKSRWGRDNVQRHKSKLREE